MTVTPEAIHATVNAYIAAYKGNDRDSLVACFADDCEFTDPVGTPTNLGHAGVATFWDTARTMAESIVLELKDVTICGNEAAVMIEIHANVGGTVLIMDAVDIFVFADDGRIQTGRAYWDMAKARTA